jgi:hypothetical protein
MSEDGMFEDPDFPAAMTSLYWSKYSPASELKKMMKSAIAWERPKVISAGGTLFGAGPDPVSTYGLKHGLVNNAWFMGGAAAVAEDPRYL